MHSNLGVVVIGRNEGKRLRICLLSLLNQCQSIVYVDSGSSDDSTSIAELMDVVVVELDASRPFNASRARHEGYTRLMQLNSGLQFVFFIDGDCELVTGWLDSALAEFQANQRVAVVCGRRRERYPEKSFFNRLCDMEWDTPIGEALACGGDAVMRTDVYSQVGGFNPTVPAGEEPELCHRIRQAGWKVHRIDAEMTLHDANITRWSQWWQRYVRSGHAALHTQERFGLEYFARINKSIRIWSIGWPIMVIVSGFGSGMIGGPVAGLCGAALIFAALPAQMARIAFRAWRHGISISDSIKYGVTIMLVKLPEAVGQWRYRAEKRQGLAAGLIEYK